MKHHTTLQSSLMIMLLLLLGAVTPLLAGTISGIITGENSLPLDHSFVQLMLADPNGGGDGGNGMAFRSTQTNATGAYTFNNLPDNQYFVYANAMDYIRGFYSDPVTGQIQVVEIDADDQEIVGIDIQLIPQNDPPPPPQFGTIIGRVHDVNNTPAVNMPVGIVSAADLTTLLPNLQAHTGMNGVYHLNNIQPGTYKTCALGANLVILAYSDEVTIVANAMIDSVDIIVADLPPVVQYGSISGDVIGLQNNMGPQGDVRLVTAAEPNTLLPNLLGHIGYNGHYYINHIPAGTYMACVVGENGVILAYSAAVEVVANQTVENVDIIVGTYVGFSLSGNIYNALNEPVTSGVVELRTMDDEQNPGGMNHMHRTAHPDVDGHYVFTNVTAGQYIVSVWTMMSPVVFYPATYDIDLAQAITVVDQDVSGINITIPAPQNYTLSGYVKDAATEAPLAGIKVKTDRMGFHHFPVQDSLFYNEYQTFTDASGFYSLTLPVGRYTLAAVDTTHFYRIQFFDHALTPFQATAILLDEDMANVNFDLIQRQDSLQCSISGTITENGAAVTYPVMVVAVSSDEDWEESTVSNAGGSYTIHHIRPGSYYVAAYSLYTAPTYYNNVLTWEDATEINVNGPITGIDFSLAATDADGPCNLSGAITNGTGSGIDNVMVMLTDGNSQVLGFARTDANGAYTISNVPSQAYTVVTSKLGYESVEQNISLTGSQNMNLVLNAPTANDDATTPVASAKLSTYPNPFRQSTVIAFSTTKDEQVSVRIFNIKGQCIKNLLTDNIKSGSHTLTWDGTDNNGKHVSSGIYMVKLQGNGFQNTHKLTIMK
jgi:hypothetical protein